jgi:putative transposase
MTTSKQAIHQYLERQLHIKEEELCLLPLIADIRKDHPTMSCRAMYFKLKPETFGRDSFEELCRANGFSIEQKPCYKRTTDSFGVTRFKDLTKDLVLTGINQMFSSDITYYEISGRFYYITFVLDCYSRMIVGHSVSTRMFTEQTTLPALEMAIKLRRKSWVDGIIFHSDGGGQYYDKAFLQLTTKYKLRNSMCEYAWENGKAERINGVIKNNYLRHLPIANYNDLVKNVDRVVSLYNTGKPHKALNYLTPLDFENKLLTSLKQTTPKMKESFKANR